MQSSNQYKVILVGDSGVGKSTFIHRWITGEFRQKYIATIGAEVHPIPLDTNHGMYTLNIWDISGQEKFGGLRDGYYAGANAAILMFDLTNKLSFKRLREWIHDIRRVKDIPIIICGNKSDIPDKKVHAKHTILYSDLGFKYYDISSKSEYLYEKPFLSILKTVTGKDNIKIQRREHKHTHSNIAIPARKKVKTREILRQIRDILNDANLSDQE
jgi:GTP-binding nuclear protein Ran